MQSGRPWRFLGRFPAVCIEGSNAYMFFLKGAYFLKVDNNRLFCTLWNLSLIAVRFHLIWYGSLSVFHNKPPSCSCLFLLVCCYLVCRRPRLTSCCLAQDWFGQTVSAFKAEIESVTVPLFLWLAISFGVVNKPKHYQLKWEINTMKYERNIPKKPGMKNRITCR